MLGWELPPYNSGGLGVACFHLCRALARDGVDIEFILPYTADYSNIDFMRVNAATSLDVQEVLSGGGVYESMRSEQHSGQMNYFDTFGQSAMYEEAVGRIVELAEFDVIHVHDWLTCRAGLRAKVLTGKPLIVHMHSLEADRSGKPYGGNPMVREIEGLALLIADRIIAVSEYTKKAIAREYDIPLDKIDVVHNLADESTLIEQSDENDYNYLAYMKQKGYRVVANVGRFTIQKGLTNLLRAFSIVIQHAPKTLLLLGGAGDQYFELVSLSAELGIARNVLFSDFQRGKRYRDEFTIADLFVMPSISEPFGIVALEAIGYGTPVLVSKQAGVGELIHNALKVDFWDIKEMANQITAVVSNDALRDELHKNSFAEWQKMSWGESANKVMSVYNKLQPRVAA
jgi:glycogen synthase